MIQAKRDRPAWPLFLIILLLGICFMLAAGQVAIQLVPTWSLIADVDSNIDPNDQLAKWSDSAPIEPVSAAILTQPAWKATYLTPGASIFVPPIVISIPTLTSEASNTPQPTATQGLDASVTPVQPTIVASSTPIIIFFPTSTMPPAPTRTRRPTKEPTSTEIPSPTNTPVTPDTPVPTPVTPDTPVPTLVTPPTPPVVLPPSCKPGEALIEITVPTVNTYSLSNSNNNCLFYRNSAYTSGGYFTISNDTLQQFTLHYDCGSNQNPTLDSGKTGNYNVSIAGDYMVVRITAPESGTITVKVEPSSGSCP